MKKVKVLVMGLVVVLAMSGLVYAQGEIVSQNQDNAENAPAGDGVGLTQEQKDKLKNNREYQMEEFKRLHGALKEKQKQLLQELGTSDFTKGAVQSLANEIVSLHSQIINLKINSIFSVKEILTPEQFVKFQQVARNKQKNKRERFQDRKEKRNGNSRGSESYPEDNSLGLE